MPADDTREDEGQHHRGQDCTGIRCRATEYGLDEQRQVEDRSEHPDRDQESREERWCVDAVLEEPEVEDRFGGAQFDDREERKEDDADGEQPDDLHRSPRILGTGPREGEQHRCHARDQQGCAGVVDAMLPPASQLGHGESGGEQRQQADRHIDIENPAPAPVISDPPAEARSNDRAETEDGGKQPLPLPALGRREQIADDRDRDREERTAAETLQGTEQDELGHRLRHAGQCRANEEDDHAEQEERSPPVDIRKLAVERDSHRRCQHVRSEDPGIVFETLQLRDDARHGRANDRLVEGGQ
ncbi:hypothetical protein HRbin27_01660 [bacterium HR27]|nr:hypothetical protein HRbin27_01660 [bacterium HR27]